MRYIFLVWIIVVGMVVGIAGFQVKSGKNETRRAAHKLLKRGMIASLRPVDQG